jgi:hypothetical protein
VKGEETVPTCIQKWSEAEPPAGIITVCPRVAVSAAGMPPNQSQKAPVRGGEAPPPVPHDGTSHNGVPKFVEVSGFQNVFGMPPVSNPPSTIKFVCVQGVALAEALAVAVGEAVAVGVGTIGVVVTLAVGVGVVPGLAVAEGVGDGALGVTSPGLMPAQYGPVGPPSGLVVATGT